MKHLLNCKEWLAVLELFQNKYLKNGKDSVCYGTLEPLQPLGKFTLKNVCPVTGLLLTIGKNCIVVTRELLV